MGSTEMKTVLWFASLVATAAHAQSVPPYPAKPIRMIVTAAGSGPDITARIVGQKLTAALGQSVVIENRPGRGRIDAAELAASAARG